MGMLKKMAMTMVVMLVSLMCITSLARADTLDEILQRKKILVAIDLTSPPFGMTDKDNRPYGSDVAVAQMLAKDLGVKLEIVPVTGPNRIGFLLTGKADIVIASFSITPERQKIVDFSLPYSASTSVVAAPATININTLADLSGKRLGLVRGNLQESLLTPIVPKDTVIVHYDDDAANAAALLSGQVDAIGTARALVLNIAKSGPGKHIEVKIPVKVFPHGIGIRKDNPKLKARLDSWVTTNMKNGRLTSSYTNTTGGTMPDLSAYFH